MYEKFEDMRLSSATISMIGKINKILLEYASDGYDLTLRQLYYQLVSRGVIENSIKSYKQIGSVVTNGRLVGLIDWGMIVDRGRTTTIQSHWDSVEQIIRACAEQFNLDKWSDQPNHIEVMVEKQALEGVLIPICTAMDIRFTANKGYSSSSALYETGKRLARMSGAGKNIHILYLGDHDPSGIDMTRDVRDRLNQFSGVDITVTRLALNMNQVDELKPPENPAKQTDSRFDGYEKEFGESSWELDAIEPRNLAAIVESAVLKLRDDTKWNARVLLQDSMRYDIHRIADDCGRSVREKRSVSS